MRRSPDLEPTWVVGEPGLEPGRPDAASRAFLAENVRGSWSAPDSTDAARAENRAVVTPRFTGPPRPVGAVVDRRIGSRGGELSIRMYRPRATERIRATMLWLHGGGWVVGDLHTHDVLCRNLASVTGATIVAVEYRRAPEEPYPAALEDALDTARWVLRAGQRDGLDGPLFIGGDSAGGTLATVVARHLRADVSGQILFYPVVDHDLTRPSYRRYEEGFGLDRAAMRWFWDQYVPDPGRRSEGDAAPLRSDATGAPPALIVIAECDVLYDEATAYAHHLRRSDVEVDVVLGRGQIHGFVHSTGRTPVGLEVLHLVGSWVGDQVN